METDFYRQAYKVLDPSFSRSQSRIAVDNIAKGGKGVLDMLYELLGIPHFLITPFLPGRGLLQQTPMQQDFFDMSKTANGKKKQRLAIPAV